MCGIFGVSVKSTNEYTGNNIKKITKILFKLSESRGKEAAGLAAKNKDSIDVLKLPVSASCLLKSSQYKKFSANVFNKKDGTDKDGFLTVIGHSRLATHGTENFNRNNQPVIKENAVCVHNGIIANDRELWKRFPVLKQEYEVDTEVLVGLLQFFLKETGSITSATQKTFGEIEGSASLAMLFNNNQLLLLATNTGSLYIYDDPAKNIFLFASERYILEQLIGKIRGIDSFKQKFIQQLSPGTALAFDVQTLDKNKFSFLNKDQTINVPVISHNKVGFVDYSEEQTPVHSFSAPTTVKNFNIRPEIKKTMYDNWNRLYSAEILKRCTKCLLPETIPFIDFDDQGICNFCRNHKNLQLKGEKALEEIVFKYRKTDGKPDCLVPFSGGRDSTYGLHYIKKVLKMNPVAYTYDWGVLTDVGRRNEARICGKLGIEHIIISADIRTKRNNIRKNLKAWLKKPELGTVPVLMAGDKQFWYYAEWLKKKMKIDMMIYSRGNGFEDDPFKVGFAGVRMKSSSLPIPLISIIDKIKLAKYYTKEYILNPAYINRSLFDTIFSFFSFLILPDRNPYLYHYIKWDEQELLKTIINEYNWETESDTKATWRIDDGTAPFYNYIYMTVAGFTEFDTFRSAQIREGDIDRETAYGLIKEENKPRFESIEWYARTIGFDPNKAIERVNSVSKIYKIQ